jgi:hypothetical protein
MVGGRESTADAGGAEVNVWAIRIVQIARAPANKLLIPGSTGVRLTWIPSNGVVVTGADAWRMHAE